MGIIISFVLYVVLPSHLTSSLFLIMDHCHKFLTIGLLASPVQVCYGQKGVDLTLQQDAMGPNVVRSVLSRIRDSNAFDEPSTTIQRQVTDEFIREMAYVESSDGINYPSDVHDGGIWRMNRNIFEQTRQYNHPLLFDRICQFFCIDWRNGVRYSDLRRPLYSGLAVKIYLFYLHNTSRGFSGATSDEGRASFWISNFGRSAASGSRWMTSVRELRNNEVSACRVDTDVMFVLDSSGSIGENNYERVKDYAYNFTASLLNNNRNRIGVILYGNRANVEIRMNFVTPMLLDRIRNLSYLRQYTNTPEGLCLLTLSSHTPWRVDISVLRFAIVLTDGHSNMYSSSCMDRGNSPGTVDSTSARLHALDPQVVVFAIGVGNNTNRTELNVIATSPALVDRLDSFDYRDLEQNQRSRAYILCYEETQAVTIGGEENGSVEMGTVSRLQFSGPASEGVTVRVCINRGTIVIYGSYATRNPSAAFHDFSEVLSAANGEVIPVMCHTTYVNVTIGGRGDSCSMCESNTIQRKKRQAEEVAVYITIEGMSTNGSQFSINSSRGNVMFDVNECAESSNLCGVNAECRNTDGSYYCQCLPGYRRDGQNCSNINECMEGVHMCNETEDCIDTEGSYSCECMRGFHRIDQHCERLVIRAFHDVVYVIVLGALCVVALLALLAAIIIYRVYRCHRRNNTKY